MAIEQKPASPAQRTGMKVADAGGFIVETVAPTGHVTAGQPMSEELAKECAKLSYDRWGSQGFTSTVKPAPLKPSP